MAGFFVDPEFWILVAFLIVVAVIGYKGAPAVTALLDQRSAKIRQELDEARRLRDEAQQALAEYQRKQLDARSEAEEILAHARAEAERAAERGHRDLEAALERRRKMATERIAARRGEGHRRRAQHRGRDRHRRAAPHAAGPARCRAQGPTRRRRDRAPAAGAGLSRSKQGASFGTTALRQAQGLRSG